MGFTYLLFDLDNTLFDFDASERHAFRHALCRQGFHFSQALYERYHEINAHLWHQYDLALLPSKEFLLTERFRQFLAEHKLTGDAERMNRDMLSGLGEIAIPFPDAVTLCQTLAENHKLFAITNAVESVQRKRFAASPLAPYFTDVFISETIGYGKPRFEFFEHVMRAVPGMTKENTLVIGDSLSSDIQGANNADLPCCWYNPKGLPRPDDLRIDYEVRTLPEILPIVK